MCVCVCVSVHRKGIQMHTCVYVWMCVYCMYVCKPVYVCLCEYETGQMFEYVYLVITFEKNKATPVI